jgi:DNA-binding winged helix-turn-helix (wHTH) protein/tetratricopeptide (TPR) repeat protein
MEVAFGECELSTDRMELRRAGVLVAVEPQVFEVLAHLVAHRDRMVPKTELLDEIWGDRFVSESALTSRIKTARRLIGDTGRDQRMIRTIHGRGYRFVGDVAPVEAPAMATAQPEPTLTSVVTRLRAGTGAALEVVADPATATDALDNLVDDALGAGLVLGRASGARRHGRQLCCVVEALDEMTQRRPELLDQIPAACRIELESLFAGGMPSTRQRLFVSAREILVAASRIGALLVIDDFSSEDPDTTALVVDAARHSRRRCLAVVVSARMPRALPGFDAVTLEAPVDAALDGGNRGALDPSVVEFLARAALLGPHLDELAVRAAAGDDEDLADHARHHALDSGVLTTATARSWRFADPDVHEAFVERVPARRRSALRAELARALHRAGAGPDRVATLLIEAGHTDEAAPFALLAARSAATAQLHGEVLRWVDAVGDAGDDAGATELLALRADALVATGAPTAVAAYRAALARAPEEVVPGLRARLARAAMLTGDLSSAEEALDGLEPTGGPADGAILLARGMFAYFAGDLEGAEAAAEAARALALEPGAPSQLLDVITLQGMIAHNRGQWFDRLRRELRATSENPALATTVFDSHLCVAEYLLYGPTGYDEIRRLTADLRAQAERSGARRAVAFAVTVSGEAALLAGELDDARRDLGEAIELHREMGADTGTAHAMQRLAEVELASGDRSAAERIARGALPLARWSPLGRHLLQRVYGTLMAAAPDADAAVAVVEEAAQTLDEPMACVFCQVMIAVPATIACAEAGRLDEARRHLATAELSAALWDGTSWQAAISEAKAHLALAEGRPADAERFLARAASLFTTAGQPLDAARCRDAWAAGTAPV